MKKLCLSALCALMSIVAVCAQSDDDFFFDDDLFADDVVVTTSENSSSSSDLKHGVLFENGSVKLGGSIDTSLGLIVPLYVADSPDTSLGDNIYSSTLTPTADALLYVDARPTQNLRLYTKFGWKYPYQQTVAIPEIPLGMFSIPYIPLGSFGTFYVKELFTDFSVADRVFFRFGQHTVSWGTGYFFSPVSDMINSSAVDPENPTAQVNGALNLRAQIVFPGTQNCLWAYIVPASSGNARDTALAAKGEFVVGGWELGAGALYKYQTAPKVMFTASGSLFSGKVAVFCETVLQYGTQTEWSADADSWEDKTFTVQATAGTSYTWKDPQITVMAQYLFDSNKDDHQYLSYGNNLALTVLFSKVGTEKLSANLMGLFYFNKDAVDMSNASASNSYLTLAKNGIAFMPYSVIASASLSYNPVKNISVSAGPYFTWQSFSANPDVSFKLTATLGGGSF